MNLKSCRPARRSETLTLQRGRPSTRLPARGCPSDSLRRCFARACMVRLHAARGASRWHSSHVSAPRLTGRQFPLITWYTPAPCQSDNPRVSAPLAHRPSVPPPRQPSVSPSSVPQSSRAVSSPARRALDGSGALLRLSGRGLRCRADAVGPLAHSPREWPLPLVLLSLFPCVLRVASAGSLPAAAAWPPFSWVAASCHCAASARSWRPQAGPAHTRS